MSSNHLLTLSAKQQTNNYTFDLLGKLSVEIELTSNPYLLPLENLFSMAARINKKRGFLFVSKVLGKHIPVDPALALLTGQALAARYMEVVHGKTHPERDQILAGLNGEAIQKSEYRCTLNDQALFIGFAETATALGHAVFENFENASFFHTTRELVSGMDSIINFEEEHSHATSHRCYVDKSLFENDSPIVLVDDEVTTGKTALNIIESIQSKYPRREYTVVSILDWRSEEDQKRFKETEERLGVTIHTVSLITGLISTTGNPVAENQAEKRSEQVSESEINEIYISGNDTTSYSSELLSAPYIIHTGRFGLSDQAQLSVDDFCQSAAARLLEFRKGKKTLCLGTGEFMYVPMKTASFMGEGIFYQSTTRSPIHPVDREDYAVKSGYPFTSPEDGETANFFYNAEQGQYDEVFVFFERAVLSDHMKSMMNQLKRVFPIINLVFFSTNKKGSAADE
ncbi:phosphoribosyltransferase family protein [Metabacillus hrfriensis]|uniref:Phosphoribosyltransferase family protein n=1 Tax=Metabacillus hrfriensis TaxID=3048891 RepID=A0ACD4RB68_9BACI|nr:phosphoribosyltransferase family protein [Metabacillus sp. CT-WN-B3]WHZ57694.1 phosphoribosyltransferase family protein [Metabacillus sp. CT-WN-B3]